MEHLMLDIETLGTDPGAVILSIAAVEFDLKTGNTGREYFWKIDLKDSMEEGFKINADTLIWWLNQDIAVLRDNIIPDGITNSVRLVMEDFWSVLKYSLDEGVKVWGNSNRFDIGIIEPYIKKVSNKLPWRFSNERDVRTLVAFNPDIKTQVIEKAKNDGLDLHNPIVDCKLQIEYCSKIYNTLSIVS